MLALLPRRNTSEEWARAEESVTVSFYSGGREGLSFRPADWSRDQRHVLGELWKRSQPVPGTYQLTLEGGALERLTDSGGTPRYLPDGNVVFIDQGRVEVLELGGRRIRTLLDASSYDVTTSTAGRYLSPDGRFIYLMKKELEGDIWMAEIE